VNVSILDGSTFVVSDRSGDIDASPDQPHGLFHKDTRFLSLRRLTVDDAVPHAAPAPARDTRSRARQRGLSSAPGAPRSHRSVELRSIPYRGSRLDVVVEGVTA
jgi:hypothetical protein